MKKLLMLKGLPASGKSTYAKELAASPSWVRVNKDDLRAMMHGGVWSKPNEKQIIQTRDQIISSSLERGCHVVVDDTNFAPSHETALRELAKLHKAAFAVDDSFLNVSPEECIKRDLSRPSSVGRDVIMRMYDQYLKPAPPVYEPPKGQPTAVIVDIDGTLAHGVKVHRGPFEWDKVGDDTLDKVVYRLVLDAAKHHKIIIMTGRDGVCEGLTLAWLRRHSVPYDAFYMRTKDDSRKDAVIKLELFEKHIRKHYQVAYVLDDRDQMVKAWRSIGLKVLQVAEGDF